MDRITETIRRGRILVSDGAWGTFLYKKGLKSGECPELWNIDRFTDVYDIAKRLIDAGANIIGGCCGTTPAHIRAIKAAVEAYNRG